MVSSETAAAGDKRREITEAGNLTRGGCLTWSPMRISLLLPVLGGLGALVVAATLVSKLGAKPETSMKKSDVSVRWITAEGKPSDVFVTPYVTKTDAEWRKQLTPEQYEVSRGKGTERAFCGVFYDHKKAGVYTCVSCGLPLFTADTKFDSGTGWPSFFAPFAPENVLTHADHSYGMVREEILCARCGGHLGHVFDDGPKPTGLRYCLNSASLTFVPKEKIAEVVAARPAL